MKVLVTGAAGFIGSYVSRALLWRGDDVVGYDNFHPYYPRPCKEFNVDLVNLASGRGTQFFPKTLVSPIYDKLEENHPSPISNKRGYFEFIEGDIVNYDFLEYLFDKEKFDSVVHLAAMAGVPLSTKNPRLYTSVNLDGTVNLLTIAKDNGIKKFVFASSSSIHGNQLDVPFKETDNVSKPVSPYASTKLGGEALCHTFSHNFKLPVVCTRFFTVYGPLQRPYGMAIQRFIQQINRGIAPTIYGDGSMARDYTFVEDTVSGILGALDTDLTFEVINLGNSTPVTLLTLVDIIKKALKREDIQNNFLPRPSTEASVTFADITKAKNLLGYNPVTQLTEGIAKQVEVFLMMPDWYRSLAEV